MPVMENVTTFIPRNFSYSNEDALEVVNIRFRNIYMYDTVIHAIFLVIGFFGNVAIIYMYSFKINKSRDDRHYILSLAYVDAMLCVFCSTFVFTKNLNPLHYPSDEACKFLTFCSNILFFTSLLILIAICIHRYRHICLSMADTMATKTKYTVIGISLAVSVVFTLPKLIYYKVIHIKLSDGTIGRVCSSDMTIPGSEVLVSGLTVLLIIISALGSIVMTVLYCLVARVIYKQIKQFKGMRIQKVRFRNLYGNLRASIINAFERENASRRSSYDRPMVKLESVAEENQLEILQPEVSVGFQEVPKCDKGTLRKNPSRNRSKSKTKSLAVYLSANRKARRSSLMFFAVTAVTVLSYIPKWTYALLDAKDPSRWFQMPLVTFHFLVFLRSLSVLGFLTHPWIYVYYDKALQKEIKKIIRRGSGYEDSNSF